MQCILKFKNEAKLEYAKRIDDPDTEDEAKFPELNDEEGDVETVRVEHHQLENGGEGHERDLELQNCDTQGLHVRSGLQKRLSNESQLLAVDNLITSFRPGGMDFKKALVRLISKFDVKQ